MTEWITAVAVALGVAVTAAQQPPQPASAQASERAAEDARVKAEDIDTLLAEGKVVFLDVREPNELEELGTLPGYINIPLGQLEKRLGELPKDKAILTA
jgi:3-mercaptopyruvate sulfurtransferase SseA